jgi:hypothetical protein
MLEPLMEAAPHAALQGIFRQPIPLQISAKTH